MNIIKVISQPSLSNSYIYDSLLKWYNRNRHIYTLVYGYDLLIRQKTTWDKLHLLQRLWDKKYNKFFKIFSKKNRENTLWV